MCRRRSSGVSGIRKVRCKKGRNQNQGKDTSKRECGIVSTVGTQRCDDNLAKIRDSK